MCFLSWWLCLQTYVEKELDQKFTESRQTAWLYKSAFKHFGFLFLHLGLFDPASFAVHRQELVVVLHSFFVRKHTGSQEAELKWSGGDNFLIGKKKDWNPTGLSCKAAATLEAKRRTYKKSSKHVKMLRSLVLCFFEPHLYLLASFFTNRHRS